MSPGRPASHLLRVDYLGPLPERRGQRSVLTGINTFWIRISLLQASPSTYLFTIMVPLTTFLLNKALISQQKKYSNWLMTMKFFGPATCPSSRSSWPDGKVESPTEGWIMSPTGRQHLDNLWNYLTGCSICFESTTHIKCYFSLTRIHGSGNQGLKLKGLLLLLHLITNHKNFASHPWDVGLHWFRVISSQEKHFHYRHKNGSTELKFETSSWSF